MKIFSLESKASLVVWSVVLGLFFDGLSYRIFVTPASFCLGFYAVGDCIPAKSGFPIRSTLVDIPFLLIDLLFWILISFIILFAVRFFRKKSVKITTNL